MFTKCIWIYLFTCHQISKSRIGRDVTAEKCFSNASQSIAQMQYLVIIWRDTNSHLPFNEHWPHFSAWLHSSHSLCSDALHCSALFELCIIKTSNLLDCVIMGIIESQYRSIFNPSATIAVIIAFICLPFDGQFVQNIVCLLTLRIRCSF